MITMNPSIAPAPVSEGQRSNFAPILGDAVRKAAGTMVEDLSKRGIIHSENFQKVVVERGDIIARVALQAVKTKIAELAESVIGRFRLISGAETLTIPATVGKRTIAKAKKVFTAYLDADFKGWGLDIESNPTPETLVEVHELIRDGNFAQIYGDLDVPLTKLVLTQDQIIAFVETHKKWLRTDGYGTFFLFKENVKGEDKFFVAGVRVVSGGLDVGVDEFSSDYVWYGVYSHRFVIPQLTA